MLLYNTLARHVLKIDAKYIVLDYLASKVLYYVFMLKLCVLVDLFLNSFCLSLVKSLVGMY